jgi:homoserine kinase type II
MAVYTHVSAELLSEFLRGYDCGELVSAKGIAEGVENSNYLVDTNGGRFILTLYEKRVSPGDLPYFLSLLTHLADRGLPVPRPIPDREGRTLQTLEGRPACLIEFLPGISMSDPGALDCRAAGEALGRMHLAAADFAPVRENSLGLAGWHRLGEACGARAAEIDPGLADLIADELAHLDANWPAGLPRGTIHADLFPDNVLHVGHEVTGLIDFYFACTDIRAYDLAVCHAAWTFSADGRDYRHACAAALGQGYRSSYGLSAEEVDAFPTLCRGAALRFLLTRAFDWLNTSAGAVVTLKDPLAFRRRLDFYRQASPADLLGHP